MSFSENAFVRRLPAFAVAAVIGLAVTAGLLGLCALAMASGFVDVHAAPAVTAVCTGLGAAMAGFLAARPTGRQILPVGLCVGGMYAVMVLVIGLCIPGTMEAGAIAPTAAAALAGACVGALGSVMGKR